jgi:hypothetical protein
LPQVVLRQLDLRPDNDIATPPKLTDAVRVISRVLEGVEHAAELGDTEVFIHSENCKCAHGYLQADAIHGDCSRSSWCLDESHMKKAARRRPIADDCHWGNA